MVTGIYPYLLPIWPLEGSEYSHEWSRVIYLSSSLGWTWTALILYSKYVKNFAQPGFWAIQGLYSWVTSTSTKKLDMFSNSKCQQQNSPWWGVSMYWEIGDRENSENFRSYHKIPQDTLRILILTSNPFITWTSSSSTLHRPPPHPPLPPPTITNSSYILFHRNPARPWSFT